MLTHVLFDLYGTLLEIRTDERSAATAEAFQGWLAARHGPEAARRAAARPLALELATITPAPLAHAEPDVAPVIAAHLHYLLCRPASPSELDEAAERFRSCSRRQLELVPGARDALSRLSGVFRLGLVSNAQRLFTAAELERFELGRWLEPVVLSSDVGVRKPGTAIFAVALERAQARAAHTLYVGNDPLDDVQGAAAAGLRTCLVGDGRRRHDRAGREVVVAGPLSGCEPDLRLGSVAELPEALLGPQAPAWARPATPVGAAPTRS